MLNILIEIQQGLQEITPTDITRAEISLAPKEPGDKPLGTVTSEDARNILALSRRYEGVASNLEHRANFDVSTEADKHELLSEAHRMTHAATVCLSLFWIEARNEMGTAGWQNQNIGVRKDWLLVTPKKRALPDMAKLFSFTEE